MIAFADTSYWIALLDPNDGLHKKVLRLSKTISLSKIITSQMVLVEMLAAFGHDPHLRSVGVRLCDQLHASEHVEVMPQSAGQFFEGLSLYRTRMDKEWSLTDCASFLIMRHRRINLALTHDHHFVQAGFKAMLRDDEK